MSSHAVAVSGGWSVWREVFLRGAGFPVEEVLALASPEAALAAERFLDHEALRDEVTKRAEAALRLGKENPELAKECKKVLRKLKKRLPFTASGELIQAQPEVGAFGEWAEENAALWARVQQKYSEDEERLAETLAEVATKPNFREALLWQNPTAAKVALPRVREVSRKVTAKQRMRWRLVANYLQRYCTKNDTIGFFGPVGWARITDGERAVRFSAGDALLSSRRVYFEYWAIETLAAKYSEDEALWPAIVPRRNPSGWLVGSRYIGGDGQESELPEEFCAALKACDAERTIADVCMHLAREGVVEAEEDAHELLFELANLELIYARFEVPTTSRSPEDDLLALLSKAPQPGGRAATSAVERLRDCRKRVEEAGGDPLALARAMEALNQTFEEVAETDSTRAGGQTYAGRTLVYEDCVRDVQLEISASMIREISEPLVPVLQSARWFCYEIAERYKRAAREVYEQIKVARGGAEVRFLELQEALAPLFPGPGSDAGIVCEVRAELQSRWHELLELDASRRLESRDVDSVRAAAEVAFPAPAPGWPCARHQSPDVLLSAESLEAIGRGEYRAVLGEIHVGHNTVGTPDNSYEHPNPKMFGEAREAELPVGITPTWNQPLRVMLYSMSERDFELETASGRSHRPRSQVLSSGSCVVFLRDEELYVRSLDGGPEFHLLAFIEQHLISESYSEFQILGGQEAHTPRVSLGNLVIQRESWRVESNEIPGTREDDRTKAYVALRRWAAGLGLPRFLFVKTQAETKPFFVDLRSAVLVANFLRHAQAPGTVRISEMLPDMEHAWLEDGQGRRYCSELRLCYVDPKGWPMETTR